MIRFEVCGLRTVSVLGVCFVFGCSELTGTGATCHAVDRECALLLELSRKRPLQHSLTQTRAFGRPQTPTTQRHRWRTLRRAHSKFESQTHDTASQLFAGCARLRETAQLASFIRCWLCACCSHCLNRFSTTHKTRALGPLV